MCLLYVQVSKIMARRCSNNPGLPAPTRLIDVFRKGAKPSWCSGLDAVGVKGWGGMTPSADSTPLHKPSKSEAEYNSEVHQQHMAGYLAGCPMAYGMNNRLAMEDTYTRVRVVIRHEFFKRLRRRSLIIKRGMTMASHQMAGS